MSLKKKCAINATLIIVDNKYKIWNKKKVYIALLINVKAAFDYIFKLNLIYQIKESEIDNNLIG